MSLKQDSILAARKKLLSEKKQRFLDKYLWESMYPVGYSKYYNNQIYYILPFNVIS